MNNTQITIRINSETKAKAHSLFNSLGLDLSTAINMFLNEAIEFQGIPFIIRRYNGNAEPAFIVAQEGIRLSRPFGSAEALGENADADDKVS
ncbi:MAG: type II toxin-antitoxin system RelB/DinJ family antitoxin [Ruminiclostridium sp.]|nr:type II toxin-antitoxin system RelB/DinJ family antitoxin [Ruminiclostridium sp.]